MKPWELAARWYERFLPQENFANAVADNFRRDDGHIYSCGDIFAMGQEVRWDNEQKQIVAGEPNAWFAELVAVTGSGNPLHRIMSIAPHPHEWCLWQRRADGRMRAHRWQDLIAKLQGE